MQTQAQSLLENVRRSFESRKHDHQARLAFLQEAKILDANGEYNDKVFSKPSTNSNRVRAK